MPKQTKPRDKKILSSKKVNPAITVAVIALVGTLLTALFSSPVLIAWIQKTPAPPAQANPPTFTPSDLGEIANPLASPPVPSISEGDAGCLTQYFADIEPAKQVSIEVGVYSQDFYFSSQELASKAFVGPFGIILTQNGRMIAALSFLFFTDSQLFKITSVVDSNCQAVTEYSNATRGGDPNAIEDSDDLQIQIKEGTFVLDFEFSGTNYVRFSFQQLR